MIDSVEQHKEDLSDLAETDLPCSRIAEALLDVADETED